MTFLDRKPVVYLWRPCHRILFAGLIWPFLHRVKQMFMSGTDSAFVSLRQDTAELREELAVVGREVARMNVQLVSVRSEIQSCTASVSRIDLVEQVVTPVSAQLLHLQAEIRRVEAELIRRENLRNSDMREQWAPIEELLLCLYRNPESQVTQHRQTDA